MKKVTRGLKIVLMIITFSFVLFSIINRIYLKEEYLIYNNLYNETSYKMTQKQLYLIKSQISVASRLKFEPWKITVENDDLFSVSTDLDKKLPIIDQTNHQISISQGILIENVKYNSEQSNIDISDGYSPINIVVKNPTNSTFMDINSINSDLDKFTQTSFINSTGKSLVLEKIIKSNEKLSHLNLELVTDSRINNLKKLLRLANRIESENEEFMIELLEKFRFSRWDMNQYKYGLSLDTIHPMIDFFINPTLKIVNDWKQFGQSSTTEFEERLDNEFGYILVKKQNSVQSDYVLIDELLSKLTQQLKVYRIQPTYQVFEDLSGMDEVQNQLRKEFSQDEEIIMIIGLSHMDNQNDFSLRY